MLNRQTRHGGILWVWSERATSHCSGQDEALSMGGGGDTTMLGADYQKGPLVTGLSLSYSRGVGEYAATSGSQVSSAVPGAGLHSQRTGDRVRRRRLRRRRHAPDTRGSTDPAERASRWPPPEPDGT